MTEEIDPAPVS